MLLLTSLGLRRFPTSRSFSTTARCLKCFSTIVCRAQQGDSANAGTGADEIYGLLDRQPVGTTVHSTRPLPQTEYATKVDRTVFTDGEPHQQTMSRGESIGLARNFLSGSCV